MVAGSPAPNSGCSGRWPPDPQGTAHRGPGYLASGPLKAKPDQRTQFATGLVDLGTRRMIDFIEGNSADALGAWIDRQPSEWLERIKVVATDLTNSYRAGLSPALDHAIRVADPFHVTRLGARTVDQVRRRVQREELGHRGRRQDPLYKIRRLLLRGSERLDDRGW